MKERDIEFIPTDELIEEATADPEDEAADVEEVEQLAGLGTQAENCAAEELEGVEADEFAVDP